MKKHLNATQESGKGFYIEFQGKGKIVMLNLLKFRANADYSDSESLKPQKDISGKAAYQLYMDHTQPELEKVGSRILFYGSSQSFVIGPEHEKWDAVLLVEHQSAEIFIQFSQNKNYLKTVGHRIAALEDSRLLPIKASDNYK